MRRFLERGSPPGYDWQREAVIIGLMLVFSLFFSCFFINELQSGLRVLRYWQENQSAQKPEILLIPYFHEMLRIWLMGFPVTAAFSALCVLGRSAYLRQGSRGVYLLRRLPDRWEEPRRCLRTPVFGALTSLALGFLILLIYYGAYMLAIPGEYRQPQQWARLWMAWTGGTS